MDFYQRPKAYSSISVCCAVDGRRSQVLVPVISEVGFAPAHRALPQTNLSLVEACPSPEIIA
jgi:hypothetical protein